MSKISNWVIGLWESIFPKKQRFNMEELCKGTAGYVSANYSPTPMTSAREDSSEYAATGKNPSAAQKPKYSMRDGQVQFQKFDEDPIPGLLRSSLSPSETKALGILLDERRDKSFRDRLFELIDQRGYPDVYVYKRAQIDRRLFSKIIGDRFYRPAKDTVLAFALALKCSLPEANMLLESAGYMLSKSSRRDIMIEYFFKEGIYDLTAANTILYQLGEKIIGRANVG